MSNFTKLMQQAASGVGGGDFYPYTVDYSARFNDDDDAKMYRTHSTPTSDQKFTYSTWFKYCNVTTNAGVLFYVRNSAWNRYFAIFAYPPSGTYNGRIYISSNPNGSIQDIAPSALFKDFSAWYHLVLAVDSTQAVATDRVKVYINGERVTDWLNGTAPNNVTLNQSISPLQSGGITAIGGRDDVANVQKYDGYLSQTTYIDGTAYAATDFGESKNGIWVPKDISGLSFGNNGYYLDYASSSAFGNDVSGNNNDLTTSGLTSSDQMIDTPTNNFANLSIAAIRAGVTSPTLSDGNLEVTTPDSSAAITYWAFPSTGKYYFEIYYKTQVLWYRNMYHGISFADVNAVAQAGPAQAIINFEDPSQDSAYNLWGTWYSGPGVSQGEFGAVLVDMDNNEVTLYRQGSATVTSSFPAAYIGKPLRIQMGGDANHVAVFNFGQDGTFGGSVTAQGNTDANGIGDFYYTVPTDALALCTANFPEPTIGPNSATTSDEHFDTLLWVGDGSSSKNVTGLDFTPDFTWIKNRSSGYSHVLSDVIRGDNKFLASNGAGIEETDSTKFRTFVTGGIQVGSHVGVNQSGSNHVAWNWKGNGSGVSNTDGDITSTVSANTDAGISIVTYTGNASYGQTVGHGLGVAPQVVICKNRSNTRNWRSYFETLGATKYINLDENTAAGTYGSWNNTAPTSSVFSTTDASSVDRATNYSGDNFVAYCFAEVEGFSKFGSWTGVSGSEFIYTGFRPAFVLVKRTNASGWYIFDNKRGYNGGIYGLSPNTSGAETGPWATQFNLYSNGFEDNNYVGDAGTTILYMAFAENPFKYSNAR